MPDPLLIINFSMLVIPVLHNPLKENHRLCLHLIHATVIMKNDFIGIVRDCYSKDNRKTHLRKNNFSSVHKWAIVSPWVFNRLPDSLGGPWSRGLLNGRRPQISGQILTFPGYFQTCPCELPLSDEVHGCS